MEKVKTFRYLGVVESHDGKIQTELNRRIVAMRVAYASSRAHIYQNKYLSTTAKLNLYTVLVTSAALYGSAMWSLNRAEIGKLESINFKFLRYIVPNMTRMSSYEDVIIEATDRGAIIIPIECLIAKRSLRFLGHVERMSDTTLQKIVIHSRLFEGVQKQGAPYLSYRHAIFKSLVNFGLHPNQWNVVGKDRQQWYSTIERQGVYSFIREWLKKREVAKEMRCAHKLKEKEAYYEQYLLNVN